MNTINFIIFHLLIGYLQSKPRPKEDKLCIDKNVWDSIEHSTKTIANPEVCTAISSSCCYISISYNYLDHQIDSQYCASLTGDKAEFETFFTELYTDDMLYYANKSISYMSQTDNGLFHKIGRNYDTSYVDQKNKYCGPKSPKEYSTYLEQNCAKFDDNGVCLYEKNNEAFNAFVKAFYEDFTKDSNYCNKKDDDGKCILYTGAQQNNDMVRPLLDDLMKYLNIEGEDIGEISSLRTLNEVDNHKKQFKKLQETSDEPCVDKPLGKAIVKVICPSTYANEQWINHSILFLIILSICLY